MKYKRLLKLLLTIIALYTFSSCKTVAPYERVYLNDLEMQMNYGAVKGFENYITTIREGAIPAGGTKSSGGCGCN